MALALLALYIEAKIRILSLFITDGFEGSKSQCTLIVVVSEEAIVFLAIEAAKTAIDEMIGKWQAHDALTVKSETWIRFDKAKDWMMAVAAVGADLCVFKAGCHTCFPGFISRYSPLFTEVDKYLGRI